MIARKSIVFTIALLLWVPLGSCRVIYNAIGWPPEMRLHRPPFAEPQLYSPAPDSGLPAQPADGSTFSWVTYVPYVEEVSLPNEVREDSSFTIVFKVSAKYRPAVLRGFTSYLVPRLNTHMRGDVYEPDDVFTDSEVHFRISADWSVYLPTPIKNPLGTGNPVTEFVYEVQALPEGTCRIAYFTTTDPEHGGIGWFYHEKVGPIPGDPVEWIDKYVEKREIIIEVLPREEGGSGE